MPLLRVAIAFVVALMLTPLVRSVTAGLDDSLGRAWPFSLTHCHVASTPGCEANSVSAPTLFREAAR